MINPEVTMAEQIPTVGRVVHYVSHGSPLREDGTQAHTSTCRAAIITRVDEQPGEGPAFTGLCVLNPTGIFFNEDCPQAEASDVRGGTWHWPERV